MKEVADWLREASTLAKIWRNECDLRGLPMQSNGIDKDVQLFEKRAAQVKAMTCDGCMWWDNSPWQVTPQTRLCMFPEKRSSAESCGFINDCGSKFGCIHWEEKK